MYNLDKIVELLPEGLSQTGIGEICSIIESVINESVQEEVTLLESKVSSFLNSKLEDLKEVARTQVVQESQELKELDTLSRIKELAASLVEGTETNGLVKEHEERIAELEARNETLNAMVEEKTNIIIEKDELLSESAEALEAAQSELEEVEQEIQHGVLSEMTEMPRIKEGGEDDEVEGPHYDDNTFLTEDVLGLAFEN